MCDVAVLLKPVVDDVRDGVVLMGGVAANGAGKGVVAEGVQWPAAHVLGVVMCASEVLVVDLLVVAVFEGNVVVFGWHACFSVGRGIEPCAGRGAS